MGKECNLNFKNEEEEEKNGKREWKWYNEWFQQHMFQCVTKPSSDSNFIRLKIRYKTIVYFAAKSLGAI